ncbi:hypothetical protein [Ekhidna sp. To15]|uniref:hypothetical protein n=1 Tax=Ekhidna sp. To15 TaxID=3395267 RepID=UPI003F51B9A4
MKNFKRISFLTLLIFVSQSCGDLEVENENAPDADRALASSTDLIALVTGGMGDVFYAQSANSGSNHMALQADILTATNNAHGFWHVCDQPRRELVNSTGYPEYHIFDTPWTLNNTAVANLNLVINRIVEGTVILDESEEDVTQQLLAWAYMTRGVALGSVGLVFDRGYAALEEVPANELVLVDFPEVISAAVTSFERAIETANATSTFELDFFGNVYSKDYFIALCNSFAARYAAASARNSTQAAALDWAAIRTYAQNGITDDFIPISDNSAIAGENISFIESPIADDATYIPVDQKIAWMLDPDNMPINYPTDETVLGPPTTDDARYNLYYFYSTNFGYLNASRNRAMFSNINYNRYPSLRGNASYANTPVPLMYASEMLYLEAEAEWYLGSNPVALALINSGPRSSVGELPDETCSTDDCLEHLLHYEYSIELAHSGMGIGWAYMRRHDLLQIGTPLHWAVPARELEVLGEEVYTYGSPIQADGVNTADGSNSWTNN